MLLPLCGAGVVLGILLGGAGLLALVGCSVLFLEHDSVRGFVMLGIGVLWRIGRHSELLSISKWSRESSDVLQ